MVAIVVNHKMAIRVNSKWGKETITTIRLSSDQLRGVKLMHKKKKVKWQQWVAHEMDGLVRALWKVEKGLNTQHMFYSAAANFSIVICYYDCHFSLTWSDDFHPMAGGHDKFIDFH